MRPSRWAITLYMLCKYFFMRDHCVDSYIWTIPCLSCGSRGAKGAMAPPVPVKTSHKKDGRHRRPLIFHVSCPPPPSDHPGSDTVPILSLRLFGDVSCFKEYLYFFFSHIVLAKLQKQKVKVKKKHPKPEVTTEVSDWTCSTRRHGESFSRETWRP